MISETSKMDQGRMMMKWILMSSRIQMLKRTQIMRIMRIMRLVMVKYLQTKKRQLRVTLMTRGRAIVYMKAAIVTTMISIGYLIRSRKHLQS